METSQKQLNKTAPWALAVTGEAAAVMLLNLLPHVLKRIFEKDEVFWLNAVFGVPLAFLSVFFLCFFRAANQRRFFKNLCVQKCAALPKSALSGSATLSLVVFTFKILSMLLFFAPSVTATLILKRKAESLPFEASLCLFGFSVLLFLVGAFYRSRFGSLLFLSEYVYLIYPMFGVFDCIRFSAERMTACRKEHRLLRRKLRAAGLLCVFVVSAPHALHRRRFLKNEFAFNMLFTRVK